VEIVRLLVAVLGVYLVMGGVFGVIFLSVGAARLDPALARSGRSVRLLLLPGAAGLLATRRRR